MTTAQDRGAAQRFRQFTFQPPGGEPPATVFAHHVEFTHSHVVFRDPDNEIVVAVYAGDVVNLRPERDDRGVVQFFTSDEALRLTPQVSRN